MKQKLFSSVFLMTLVWAGCSSNQTEPSVSIAFEKYVLPNGLEVVLHVDRSDPVAAVAMTFHVGSSFEVEGRTGFAHLFEHLFFLDSENLGPGGLDRLMTRVGSSTNGSTNRDRTNYFEVVPIDGLEKTLWAESDKLGYFINTVTEDVVAKEQQVVKNEKRQSYDNRPYGHTNYVIDRALYPEGHPYRWQVIGSLQDLDDASLGDVKEFHSRWYGPNNATLVVAGDIDIEQTKAWIEHYFGEIPAAEMPERPGSIDLGFEADVLLKQEDRFARLPELTLAWPTVPAYHPDEPALNVLAALLTDGKASPFYKVIVEESEVAPRVSGFNFGQELAGRFSIRVRAFDGVDLDRVLALVDVSFARFEEEGVSEEQLSRIKASREADFYSGISSVLGKAFQLAQYNLFTDTPGFASEELRRLLAVTSDDVLRVYNRYIWNRPRVAASFVPVGQGDLAVAGSRSADIVEEPIVLGAEAPVEVLDRGSIATTGSEFDRSVEPPYGASPSLTAPAVWRSELDNGLRIFGISDSELPIVQFALRVDGGMLAEGEDQHGAANLLAETMLEGTRSRTAEELELAIDLLGASINASAGNQSVTISGRTLARNFDGTMALVKEILLEPRWDEVAFQRARQRVLNNLIAREGEPTAIAADEFRRLLYGPHPLSRSVAGTPESVASLSLSDLKAYHEAALLPNGASLRVAGDVSREQVVSATAGLEAWLSGERPSVEPPVWDPQRAGLYFADVPGAVQSVVNIGFLGLAEDDPDFLPANFLNFRLGGGGFASELTQVLREGKGYTYGIGSRFSGSAFPGPFLISSRIRANVTLEALEEIKRIVETHGAEFGEDDLATTRNFYIRNNSRAFETLGAKLGILGDISDYGFEPDYVLEREHVIRDMTLDRVHGLADRFLDPSDMIWLVVGDAATQKERLSRLQLGPARLIDR
jgi:zinc protease